MTAPKIKVFYRTPKGEFATTAQACAALRCDRTTLYKRIDAGTEGYARIEREIKPKEKFRSVIKGVRWPIPWSQYRFQDDDVKESIYQLWCKQKGFDPTVDGTADIFFDEIDAAGQDEYVTEEDADNEEA